jgi:predicted small lipoprotein YifL
MRTPLLSIAALLVVATTLAACGRPAENPGPDVAPDTTAPGHEDLILGAEISAEGLALSPADIAASPTTYQGQHVRVEGTVTAVCAGEDCWLAFDNPGGLPVRVFPPEDGAGVPAWRFPHRVTGVEAIVEGTVMEDAISRAELQRYAEAAGRPQGEIDVLTQADATAAIVARGVRIARGMVLPGDHITPPAGGAPGRVAPPTDADATLPEADGDRPEPRTPTGT